MEEHQLSKVTTGMVKPSLNPHTGAYLTLHDQDRETHRSSMQELYNEDTLAADQPEPRGFEPVSNLERDPGLSPFSMDRDELTTEFYKRLHELKNEHQKTLKMLEHLHTDAETRTYQAKNYPSGIKGIHQNNVTRNGIGVEESQRESVFLTEDASVSARNEEEEVYEKEEDNEDSEEDAEDDESSLEDRRAVQSERRSSRNNDGVPHRQNVIVKQMWDDFNLKDYLPADSKEKLVKGKVKRVGKSLRPKSAAPIKQKEWSPIITIPKPFSMTLREEMKKSKSHTRSSEDVARDERDRFDQEELELQTRVRAKDPPAHTFMPLYEEIMERQEQRSRMNKENASRVLQAMVKPFSFMEREKMKTEWKLQTKSSEQLKERRKHKSMVRFVAKPVPAYVHDDTVADKMKEEQFYRTIKVKIRSDDLMKSSSLPPRMHSHEMMCAGRREQRNRDIKKATKLSFKPETHSMPNFEALHRLDASERHARQCDVAEPTMMEPFSFRTEALRQKKQAMAEANGKMVDEEEYFRNSVKSLKNRKYTSSAVSDSIPTRMTESARLRVEETKKAIAKAEEELLKLKLKERKRKEKRKSMTQEVAARALVMEKDFTNSSDQRRERLKQYQKQHKARQNEYEQELKDMNERLKHRPLLFEQQAQNSARKKAEKRYKEILRNSGLSDDMFDHTTGIRRTNGTDTRSLDEYSDDEFETSYNRRRVPTSKIGDGKNSASGSDLEEDIQSSEEEEDSRTSVKKHLDFNV